MIAAFSQSTFIFHASTLNDAIPLEFSILLTNTRAHCSCNFEVDHGSLCEHAILVLRKFNRLSKAPSLHDATWKTRTYLLAYRIDDSSSFYPLVVQSDLTTSEGCLPPNIMKKRGRPKKKRRIEFWVSLQNVSTSVGNAAH